MYKELVHNKTQQSDSKILAIRAKYQVDQTPDEQNNRSCISHAHAIPGNSVKNKQISQFKHEKQNRPQRKSTRKSTKKSRLEEKDSDYVKVVTLVTTPPQMKIKPEALASFKVSDDVPFDTNITFKLEEDHDIDYLPMDDNVMNEEVGNQRTEETLNQVFKPNNSSKWRYVCDKCDRTYSRRDTLKEHFRLKHAMQMVPAKEFPYQCPSCPKKFLLEKKLRVHQTVHLPHEEKAIYPCPYCDKK